MKNNLQPVSLRIAALGLIMASATLASAQESSVTTTSRTTSIGKVSAMGPDSISLTTTGSSLPVRYTYSKTTSYVDEQGNPVSVEMVKSGLPVTVYYDRDGDQLMANKVVVRKSMDTDGTTTQQTTSTSTTTTEGTVSQFSPSAIAVKSQTSDTPVNYTFSKTTTYVDESGNPVSVDVVKSGKPVTVYYDYVNGQPVATKVIVRKSESTGTDGTTVTEHKKTTTSTTTTEPNP